MKKLIVLLAIAIVLFTACEPTTGGGGGGGGGTPEYQTEIEDFQNFTDEGVTYSSCMYIQGFFSDSAYTNMTRFYSVQILKNHNTNSYSFLVSKAEKRNSMYGEDYWKNNFTFVTNNNYNITPGDERYSEMWTTSANSNGFHQTWIEISITTNDIAAIMGSESIRITLNATDNTTLSFKTSSEFSDLVQSNF